MDDSLCYWSSGEAEIAILIVHGVGEYGDRYYRFAEKLTGLGLDVYSYDQLGHGRRDGVKGHIDSWHDYRSELEDHYQHLLKKKYKAVGVWGHSMGSLVVLDWLEQTHAQPSFAIVSGTLVEAEAAWWRILAAKCLSRIMPKLTLPLGLDLNGISSLESEIKLYEADPLVHGQVSASWGAEVLRVIPSVRQQIGKIKAPLLIAHGAADPINNPEGSRWLATQLDNAELTMYEGVRHEVHHDTSADDFAKKVAAFAFRHAL